MPCKNCPYALLDKHMKIACHADDPAYRGKFGRTACADEFDFNDEPIKKEEK